MSRRDFLKNSAIVLGAPLAAAAGTRLYGAPASIQPREILDTTKFSLPLSRAGVPSELWGSLSRIGNLWEHVLTDDAEAARFNAAPAAYLESVGLDGSDGTLAHESIVMLRAVAGPEAKSCLKNSDYVGLFNHLASSGAFENQTASNLENKIVAVFKENYAELSEVMKDAGSSMDSQETILAHLKNAGVTLNEDDLTAVALLLSNVSNDSGVAPNCVGFALCVVVVAVAIAATVAAYISVAVAVTVFLLVAVSVSAAVQSAVTVSGGGGGCRVDPECLPILPQVVSPPFTGTYARLDPSLMRNLDRSIRLAAMTNDRNIEVEAVRSLIATEVSAVLSALKRVNLLNVEDHSLASVIDAVTAYSWKALGIAKAA